MKKILTTTAIVMSLAAPTFAQSTSETTTPDATTSTQTAPQSTDTDVSTDTGSDAQAATGAETETHSGTDTASASDSMATDTAMNTEIGSVQAQPSDLFASDLIGQRVYNVAADMDADAQVADGAETEWDDIGEINDIIVSADGQVTAVILGIGGFIGIGERDVSVPMDALSMVQEEGENGDMFLVVKSSKEELEAAPAFEREPAS